MFDRLVEMLKDWNAKGDSPSFNDRLEATDNFFKRYNLYEEMWEPQPREPMSLVWAISSKFPDIFYQQLHTMLQFDNILQQGDEIIFVVEKFRASDAEATIKNMSDFLPVKFIVVDRRVPGDVAGFNWDIGLQYAKNDRVLFIRDLVLFFQPWELIRSARMQDLKERLVNFSAILGPVWAKFHNQWMYLIHPDYAPNPFLLCFVASKQDIQSMGGFDTNLRRGYDHLCELDLLLRWNMAGFEYAITEGSTVFHPGITTNSREEVEEMQYQSSLHKRYFLDKYGDKFVEELKPPYNAGAHLIDVYQALTTAPLSIVPVDEVRFDPIKDAFDFAKIPIEKFIKEVR